MTKEKFYILSIDGGGLKGLIAIKILCAISDIINDSLTNRFDLFAGTSTGGLIVSALTAQRGNAPLYDLSYIEELYLQIGESVLLKGVYNLTESETEKFDKLLRSTFTHLKLSETYKPVFVPAYDITNKRIIVFKTRAALQNPVKDLELVDVCHATSAIPPVFSPYPLRYNGEKINCIDAGIQHLKNPALAALAEVWKHRDYYRTSGTLQEKDIVLLSVSTGSFLNGNRHWSSNINDILSDQVADMKYIKDQNLKIEFEKINFLRVDLNLGTAGFSVLQLVDWMNQISELTNDREFKEAVSSLLL
jgi:patatin-like phospholipase/acyl hydrolase